MIVPMRKYAFLAYRDDYDSFLEELRSLGVLHVQKRAAEEENKAIAELEWKQEEVSRAIRLLEKRKPAEAASAEVPELSDGLEVCRHITALEDRIEDTEQRIKALGRQLEELAPWGDFSLEPLEQLAADGWRLRLFRCPRRQFQPQWGEQYDLFEINEVGATLYFIIVHRQGESTEIDAEEVPWPAQSQAGLRQAQTDAQQRLEKATAEMDACAAAYLPLLEASLQQLREQSDWQSVLTNTAPTVDGAVMVLEGFIPQPQEQEVRARLDAAQVVYLFEKPRPEDNPPVLLKNNRFSRLFEPIGKLFALPAYQELDLTPFFAPFFMLFFGFCLGDAGYGLVVLLGATLFKRKVSADWRPIVSLAQFLGVATILMGALTGTVFGLNLLQEQYAWLGGVRNYMIDGEQAFNFALILGLIQMLFGLGLQASNRIKQYGFVYALPTFGWMILLLSLLDIGLLELAAPFTTYTAWLAVALITFFSDPKAGILGRIGKGLWDLYGITGFFGDLLSYIRLFALGISSAILGLVVNEIALQLKGVAPIIGPIIFVIFLLFGHALNLLIASLGAFVHPMRLTFVEFYKNAGFQGGGKAYAPFAPRQQAPTENNHQNTK
jgi:V/A-type H+/Na+-transporting ATPase subunit I